jgi:hypothetical protein
MRESGGWSFRIFHAKTAGKKFSRRGAETAEFMAVPIGRYNPKFLNKVFPNSATLPFNFILNEPPGNQSLPVETPDL